MGGLGFWVNISNAQMGAVISLDMGVAQRSTERDREIERQTETEKIEEQRLDVIYQH